MIRTFFGVPQDGERPGCGAYGQSPSGGDTAASEGRHTSPRKHATLAWARGGLQVALQPFRRPVHSVVR